MRASTVSQGRRSARTTAHGTMRLPGKNPIAVTPRNSWGVSGMSSSGKSRCRVKFRRWLSTTVYQRNPRFWNSTVRYHGTAMIRNRPRPAHGTQNVLGEHGQAQGRVGEEQRPPAHPPVRQDEARERHQDQEDEEEVGLHVAGKEEELEVRGNDEPRDQPQAGRSQNAPEPGGEERHAEGRQGRPEARRPFRGAGEPEARRQEPVEQRGLVEVAHAVEVRRDPVPAEPHLAGNLGMHALGRIDEGRLAQAHEEESGRHQPDPQEHAAVRVVHRLEWLAMKLLLLLLAVGLLALGCREIADRAFIYFPERELAGTPASLGLAYQDVWFQAEDGARLHGWLVPGARPPAPLRSHRH